mmetsp:Transcript_23071/g.36774  ORF Transcript_23071/g.36774 Transcript_23071/m.36774 type:complete len:314 (-) Transcript_23071:28-969(-)
MAEGQSFSKLFCVDEDTKKLVAGYIRKCEHKLLNAPYLHIVPSLVIHHVIWYYHMESFAVCGPSLSINKRKQRIVCMNGVRGTAYGSICISTQHPVIYRWSIKILSKLSSSMDMGLSICNDPTLSDNFSCGRYNYGSYNSAGRKHNYLNSFFGEAYGKPFNKGDHIEMELNATADTTTLSFYKNHSSQGVAFQHIPKERLYYFAVSLGGRNDAVRLTEFSVCRRPRTQRTHWGLTAPAQRQVFARKIYKRLKKRCPKQAKQITAMIEKEANLGEMQYMLSLRDDSLWVVAHQTYGEMKAKRSSRKAVHIRQKG